jgi:hypothetical protein
MIMARAREHWSAGAIKVRVRQSCQFVLCMAGRGMGVGSPAGRYVAAGRVERSPASLPWGSMQMRLCGRERLRWTGYVGVSSYFLLFSSEKIDPAGLFM